VELISLCTLVNAFHNVARIARSATLRIARIDAAMIP
jgi:hypothetical protein